MLNKNIVVNKQNTHNNNKQEEVKNILIKAYLHVEGSHIVSSK